MEQRLLLLILTASLTFGARSQGSCPASVTDIDGNEYPVVRIGDRCWTAKNMAAARYANGDSIPHVPYAWYAQTAGAWCAYDNVAANDSVYGKLYNWHTVADPRGLCPSGWHIPTDADWGPVIGLYGGASTAGGALKAVSPLWEQPNADATDISGFAGLPGGNRSDMGSFINLGTDGFFWSATEQQAISAWEWHLHHDWGGIDHGGVLKEAGLSCRCVYDQLVGVEEEEATPALEVYPNPTTGMVQVKLRQGNSTYTVCDALGRTVHHGRFLTGLNTLDLSAFPAGLYRIRLDGVASGPRVMKQ